MNRSTWITLLRVATVAAFIVGPVVYALQHQEHRKNLHVVTPGVLYRSGQMTEDGLRRVIHDYGIRTVVSLRDAEVPSDPPPDKAEEEVCRKLGVIHVRITPRRWEDPANPAGPAPVEIGVRQFLEVMADPANHPVLVHCFAGEHRTGAYCAIFRMEFEGWDSKAALAEMKMMGYENLDRELDIRGYMRDYQPGRRVKIPAALLSRLRLSK